MLDSSLFLISSEKSDYSKNGHIFFGAHIILEVLGEDNELLIKKQSIGAILPAMYAPIFGNGV